MATTYQSGTDGAGANAWGAAFGDAALATVQIYDEVMVPRLFSPWGRVLVDELGIAAGEAVLDVACGPGTVARIAAERVADSGRVTGCDLSAAMLAIARSKSPGGAGAPIDYLQAPADELPVPAEDFDVVTCQQGLQFFPDRLAALREMRRALRAGGRVGISVWTRIEHSPPFCALASAIEEILGAELASRYRGGPWGFPDGHRLGTLLEDAGFVDVRVRSHVLPVTFELGPPQLAATLATGPLGAAVEQLPIPEKLALIDALVDQAGGAPIKSELESNIATALSPASI